jgi:hypothetical protein
MLWVIYCFLFSAENSKEASALLPPVFWSVLGFLGLAGGVGLIVQLWFCYGK